MAVPQLRTDIYGSCQFPRHRLSVSVNLAMENDGLGRQRFWRDFIGSCDWIWMNGRQKTAMPGGYQAHAGVFTEHKIGYCYMLKNYFWSEAGAFLMDLASSRNVAESCEGVYPWTLL